MEKIINFAEISAKLEATPARSAWAKGVNNCAIDLLSELKEWNENAESFPVPASRSEFKKYCLNGAENWRVWAWGGCGLIYNEAIAQRIAENK